MQSLTCSWALHTLQKERKRHCYPDKVHAFTLLSTGLTHSQNVEMLEIQVLKGQQQNGLKNVRFEKPSQRKSNYWSFFVSEWFGLWKREAIACHKIRLRVMPWREREREPEGEKGKWTRKSLAAGRWKMCMTQLAEGGGLGAKPDWRGTEVIIKREWIETVREREREREQRIESSETI